MIGLSSWQSLNFPFVLIVITYSYESFHLVSLPVNQKESLMFTFESKDLFNLRKVSSRAWYIPKGVFSWPNIKASLAFCTVSSQMIIISIGCLGCNSFIAQCILSTLNFDLEMSIIIVILLIRFEALESYTL